MDKGALLPLRYRLRIDGVTLGKFIRKRSRGYVEKFLPVAADAA
jgi:hypothetical protein